MSCEHNWVVDGQWEGFATTGEKKGGPVVKCTMCHTQKKLDWDIAKRLSPGCQFESGDFFKKGQLH